MWADEAGLDAAARRIDDWESAISARAQRSQALSARLSAITATATSPDRSVEATVDSTGTLVDLRLDERIRHRSAARIAEQVLATTRAAYAVLAREAAEVTRATLGADDPSAQAIIDSYSRRLAGGDDARR